jgi:hypothetical protein
MFKKWVSALLIATLMVALVPFSVSASTQIPAFTSFRTTETAINAGQSVTFTIGTLAAVNHVFAEIDGVWVNAVQQTRPVPPTGTKNWTLTFTPAETQTVTLLANTTNTVVNAAEIAIPITVSGSLPGVVTINRVTRNATELFAGDVLTFTILTSEAAEFVFTQVDGTWVRAILSQTNEATGEKTWTLTVRPQVTQTLNIYANTVYTRGNVNNRQNVEIIREKFILNDVAPLFDSGRTGTWNNGWDTISLPQAFDFAKMGGIDYTDVIVFYSGNHWFNNPQERGSFTLHNLNNQYVLLTGYVGRIDGWGMFDATMNIIGDGRLLRSIRLTATDMPTFVSVSVEGIRQLRIEVTFPRLQGLRTNNQAAYAFAGLIE